MRIDHLYISCGQFELRTDSNGHFCFQKNSSFLVQTLKHWETPENTENGSSYTHIHRVP